MEQDTNMSNPIKKALDKGVTKKGHNSLLKEKYGKDYSSTKKYLKKFKFVGGHYE